MRTERTDRPGARASTPAGPPLDGHRAASRRRRRAFTLAELLVVIGIIALSLSVVLPTVRGLFYAGADTQAIAMASAMLGSARGLAIETRNYALLHVQPEKGEVNDDDLGERMWMMVMKYDLASGLFAQYEGFPPQQVPGEMGYGQVGGALDPSSGGVTSEFVSGDNYSAELSDDEKLKDFCTFNVVFSSDGSVITQVDGGDPQFDSAAPVFTASATYKKQQIWKFSEDLVNEGGVRVMTVFNYRNVRLNAAKRASILNDCGVYLCVNPYTGQLIPTE